MTARHHGEVKAVEVRPWKGSEERAGKGQCFTNL